MAIPVISSPAISSSSITMLESTRITCSVTNAPLEVGCKINNVSFSMVNTSGNAYAIDIMGWEIGTGTSMSIVIYATNASGGIRNATLTVTITSPTIPRPVEEMILEKMVNDFTDNFHGILDFNFFKAKRWKQPLREFDNQELYPLLFLKVVRENPVHLGVGTKYLRFEPLTIEAEAGFNPYDENFLSQPYHDKLYYARDQFTRYIQLDPFLRYGNNQVTVTEGKISNISIFPFVITFEFNVNCENVI